MGYHIRVMKLRIGFERMSDRGATCSRPEGSNN
uniref:Uncharacterized protein n=1 Tax=uncultured marine bacterium 442 TaxID=257392 RepID=Q6SH78_9BACT|nr:hypothetical protein MBMO_EBAC000-63A02.19 [uncultured marine bacterium 442]